MQFYNAQLLVNYEVVSMMKSVLAKHPLYPRKWYYMSIFKFSLCQQTATSSFIIWQPDVNFGVIMFSLKRTCFRIARLIISPTYTWEGQWVRMVPVPDFLKH